MKSKNSDESTKRIWCDGCYDLMHFGHANSLRQAKTLGDYLIVGVHTDEEILKHKGQPVFTLEERCIMVESIKWVDKVVKGSPYITTLETLDEHACDFCCHGDDVTVTETGIDTYHDIKAAGRYKEVVRTAGISTTGLVKRILAMIQENGSVKDTTAESPWTGSSNLYLTTTRIGQFYEMKTPHVGDIVIYVPGAFDLFHVGHVQFLKKAKSLGHYLIVGLYNDSIVKQYKGSNYPIMQMNERLLTLLACKYVSDVVIDAPYEVTKDLMDYLKVDFVVYGNKDFELKDRLKSDPFAYPKHIKKLIQIKSGSHVTTETVIQRIIQNKMTYQKRNLNKEKREVQLLDRMKVI